MLRNSEKQLEEDRVYCNIQVGSSLPLTEAGEGLKAETWRQKLETMEECFLLACF